MADEITDQNDNENTDENNDENNDNENSDTENNDTENTDENNDENNDDENDDNEIIIDDFTNDSSDDTIDENEDNNDLDTTDTTSNTESEISDSEHSESTDPSTLTPDGYTVDNSSNVGEEGEAIVNPNQPASLENLPTRYKIVNGITYIPLDDYLPETIESLRSDGKQAVAMFKDGTTKQVSWDDVFDPSTIARPVVKSEVLKLAEATNQHFWSDDNGVHVNNDGKDSWDTEYAKTNHGQLNTPTTNDPWHNILINSFGILLRRGLINGVSVTRSAIAFYDGSGNDEQNIIANFGSTAAQIGKSSARHISLTSSGLDILDGSNVSQAFFGTTARIGASNANHIVLDTTGVHTVDANGDNLPINGIYIEALSADTAKIHNLTAEELSASTAYIASLRTAGINATDISADHASISNLDTNYAQINLANVANAWIENGVVRDGAITNAMINSVSANKLTAGTIDASNITVTNLNASNITTGTINGQRIGQGSLSLDKLSDAVYTESEVDSLLSGMQSEIDGAIETWTGTAAPTLNNTPASNWTTNSEKDKHVGDVYFVVNSQSQQNGYNYRFTKSISNGTTSYSWELIKDTDITNALQRLQTAEGQINTFTSDISTLQTSTGNLITKTNTLEGRIDDAEDAIDLKVDTTTFNTLSNTVSSNSSAISNLSQTVESKADGSTVSTLSNTVNSISQTATGNSSKITQLINTLGTNADGTTKENDIVHRTSAIEQDLTGFKSTVSSTYATKQNLNDIQIGGRNLLRYDIKNFAVVVNTGVIIEGTNNRSMYCSVESGETYTISRKIVEGNRFRLYDSAQEPAVNVQTYKLFDSNDSTMKQTITIPQGSHWLLIYLSNQSDTINDGNIKVERGNKATDWTPAIEDMASISDLETAKSEIRQTTDGITTEVAKKTNKTEIISTINQSAESVTINASKINLQGSVTIGDLTTNAQNYISGIETTANNASSNLQTEISRRKAKYGTCATSYSTRVKAVTCDGFELVAGSEITVKFTNENSYVSNSVQLNVNSQGTKDIWVAGAVTSSTNNLLWGAGAVITFRYDGTQFIVLGEPRIWYGSCTTAASTARKIATITGVVICKGSKVCLAMSYENTNTGPTLYVSGTYARAIYAGNSTTAPLASNGLSWSTGYTQEFVYDGQYWRTTDSGSSQRSKTQSDAAAQTATNYITASASDGIKVHNASDTLTYVQIVNSAIDMVQNGTSLIKAYTESSNAKVRVGDNSSSHILLDSNGMTAYDDSGNNVASFSEDIRLGSTDNTHIELDSELGSLNMLDSNNNVQVGIIGYESNDQLGGSLYFADYTYITGYNNSTNAHILIDSGTGQIADSNSANVDVNIVAHTVGKTSSILIQPDEIYFFTDNDDTQIFIKDNAIHMNSNSIEKVSKIELVGTSSSNGGFLDFHYGSSTADYTSRIIEDSSGRLTFYNTILSIKSTNIDRDASNPSSTQWGKNLAFYDTSNELTGQVRSVRQTDGRITLYLEALNDNTSGTQVVNEFQIHINRSGTATYSVTNAANFRSAIGAAASSDRRLKTDLKPLDDDAVEFIKALKSYSYLINGERQVGLIAQDVHKADKWGTRMTFETQEGIDGLDDWERLGNGIPTWKLDYIRLLPPTITALQKAMTRIESLEEQITTLNWTIRRLEEVS